VNERASPSGRVITFYSYKGGVGRTMLLANIAWILASAGKRVLMIDWDLEAPGLHHYFRPFLIDPRLEETNGLIELLLDYAVDAVTPAEEPVDDHWLTHAADIGRYVVSVNWQFRGNGRLHLLCAGRQNASYAVRINTFNWQDFYDRLNGGGFLEIVKSAARADYEYTLIDSRTGVSDTSGICTVQMPDQLVVCFAANEQSIIGSAAVAASVKAQWTMLDAEARGGTKKTSLADHHRILPVLTRVELSEKEKLDAARAHVRALFRPILGLTPAGEEAYWSRAEIAHWPYYAFEEVLAVFGEQFRVPASLLVAYERLTELLTAGEVRGVELPDAKARELVLRAFLRVPGATELARRDQTMAAGELFAQPSAAQQIYISYARADDLAPPTEADSHMGFVSFLDAQLRYELAQLGPPQPRLWRDTGQIGAGDRFESLIEEAIAGSSLFLVVLSRSWLASQWCRRELDLFRYRWSSETEDQVKRRIVIVARHPVPVAELPELLRGQQGYRFFDDHGAADGVTREFFFRGKTDARYFDLLLQLAQYLRGLGEAELSLVPRSIAPAARPIPKGRMVFLAKPGADMRLAYNQLSLELEARGYAVTPPPNTDIPLEGAVAFVDAALAEAELSVHALGERLGYAPEDSLPILQLQLTRAATRTQAGGGFRRVLWVPRFLEGGEEARDPFAVVARLDRQLDTDIINGDSLSGFMESLMYQLASRADTTAKISLPTSDNLTVYVYHHPEDVEFATEVGLALREYEIATILPALEGDPAEVNRFHRDSLRVCQAFVLCWANAPEVWVRASIRQSHDWKAVGRSGPFAVRALAVGPPLGARKLMLIRLPPKDEIDTVLDMTALSSLSAEALEPLVSTIASRLEPSGPE
jgi:hypothetical protein